MSDMVDMMLDGIVCQFCGQFIDGEASGYPRSCGCQDNYEDVNDDLLGLSGCDAISWASKKKKKSNKKKKKSDKNKVKGGTGDGR